MRFGRRLNFSRPGVSSIRTSVSDLLEATENRCLKQGGFPMDGGCLMELLLGMRMALYQPGPEFIQVNHHQMFRKSQFIDYFLMKGSVV